jgi:DNA helicase-2/ATP-dependent DNA helicase PcrA
MTISELLSAVLDKSGYEAMLRTEGSQERLDNLAELKQAVYEFETSCGEESTMDNYLSHVALMTNTDAVSRKNAVKLMTVHTAKGLEFPLSSLRLEEGVFPSKKTATREAMEEERRLRSSHSRGRNSRCISRTRRGATWTGSYRYPSRFILNVRPNCSATQRN